MKVKREEIVKTDRVEMGDRIRIKLPDRNYMATAIRDEGDGMLFLFDSYLDGQRPMDRRGSTDRGYDVSEMRKFLQELAEVFPKKLRKQMKPFENGDMLRLLTITEMCGVDGNLRSCEGQMEWMTDRRHRIACRRDGEYECGWTSTAASGGGFAFVNCSGYADRADASYTLGVRPAFKILYS